MRHGFSLVELSIVLVILGLLAGGVIAGQSLVRAAELRSIPTQAQQFLAATNNFTGKYAQLPGDFNDATTFWGRIGGGNGQCADPVNDTDTGPPTCNGDGNNILDLSYEDFRFWEHLAAAGMIEGTFTGIGGSTVSHAVPGTNVPNTRLSQGGWSALTRTGLYGDSNFFQIRYGNVLQVGKGRSGGGSAYDGLITPEEAWNIDTKVDDGKPGRGKALAINWDDCTNATANTQLDTTYLLSSNDKACAFTWIRAF